MTVNTIHWYPQHIREMKEYIRLTDGVDIELEKVWEELQKIMENRYADTMDGETCKKYEKLLGINASLLDSLEDRRRRIKGYFGSDTPYTVNKLIDVLNILCGGADNYVLLIEPDKCKVSVGVKLVSIRLTENVKEIVNNIVPANMIRNVYVIYNRWNRFEHVTWGNMETETWSGLYDDEKWQEAEY